MWAWSEVFFAMFARLGVYSGIASARLFSIFWNGSGKPQRTQRDTEDRFSNSVLSVSSVVKSSGFYRLCEINSTTTGDYSGMLFGFPIAILYFLAREITAEGAEERRAFNHLFPLRAPLRTLRLKSLFGYSIPHVPGSPCIVKSPYSGLGT